VNSNIEQHYKYMWICSEGITPPSPDTVFPPEPGTWVLMLSGGMALVVGRKLRRGRSPGRQ
jgi:hypothetical protein